MKKVIRLAMLTALVLLGSNASALTLTGVFLDDTQWSLIHGGSGANPTTDPADHLRWLAGQEIVFDLTGTTLSAAGPQVFMLMADNFVDFATFTLLSFTADLGNSSGFVSGEMDYELTVDSGPLASDSPYSGTFSFGTMSAGPFNSSMTDANGVFSLFAWGGDVDNNIGIDIGISAVVPVPAPLLLLLPSLLGLGFLRRR